MNELTMRLICRTCANRYLVKPLDIDELLALIPIQIQQTGFSKKRVSLMK